MEQSECCDEAGKCNRANGCGLPFRSGVECYDGQPCEHICHSPTVTPPDNYERVSHEHCWEHTQPRSLPPCGIPLDKHTQCCLCDSEQILQEKIERVLWEYMDYPKERIAAAKAILKLVEDDKCQCACEMCHDNEHCGNTKCGKPQS